MFGLGWQELLILLIILSLIVGGVVAAKRGKLAQVAAGLGFLQGLANIAFGVLGGPGEYTPRDQFEAVTAVLLMLVQGLMMVIFAVATYKGKLYGAYGLLIVALLFALLSLVQKGAPGWMIPLVIYLLAVASLHRTRRALQMSRDATLLSCPHCGAGYRLSDYRAEATPIFCGTCKAEILRPS